MTAFNVDLKEHLHIKFPKIKFQVERKKRQDAQSTCLKWWAPEIKELYTIADAILEYVSPMQMRFAVLERDQVYDSVANKHAEFIMIEFVGVKLFKSSPWRRN